MPWRHVFVHGRESPADPNRSGIKHRLLPTPCRGLMRRGCPILPPGARGAVRVPDDGAARLAACSTLWTRPDRERVWHGVGAIGTVGLPHPPDCHREFLSRMVNQRPVQERHYLGLAPCDAWLQAAGRCPHPFPRRSTEGRSIAPSHLPAVLWKTDQATINPTIDLPTYRPGGSWIHRVAASPSGVRS